MENEIQIENNIAPMIKELIERKSKRDGIKFNLFKLSKEIGMPNSILVKLVHPDEEKRVHNPRIETIVKIAEYFKGDGFEVNVEDFFSVRKNDSLIAANSISPFIYENVIPVYSIDSDLGKSIGDIRTKLSKKNMKALAIVTSRFIPPIFEKGTVFIVDTEIKPENQSLLAVKEDGKIKIKKLIIDNNKYLLDGEGKGGKKQELFFNDAIEFVGTVIKANVAI